MPRRGPCTIPAMRTTLQSVQRLGVAAAVIAIAVFAALAAEPSGSGAATLASKRAQAAKLDAEVNKLERQYDELQERYRGAVYELDRIRADVREAHLTVVATRKDLATSKDRLAQRAGAIYRSGGTSSDLSDLATAGSFITFFDRVETIRRVGVQDANVLERVEALNEKVEKKERILREAKARAAKATARAAKDKAAMGKILAARQSKLASVNSDIRAIMDAQRRAAEARAAARARTNAASVRAVGGAAAPTPSSGGSSIPLPPGSSTAAAAANAAMSKLGSPYVWAAAGPDSFDCSGLVMWAFAQVGRSGMPHSTYVYAAMGVDVPLDQLQVGDLVFGSGDGHMGIYVGGGSFVHAPHSGDVVKVTSMSDYQVTHARRI